MRNNLKFQLSTLSAAIASTLISGYATAQQSALEEVIVTATRRAQSVQDIPINITALGSGLIERERVANLSDIAKRVPGLSLVDQGPRSGNILAVRGLSADSITAPEISQGNSGGGTVGVYMGEVPVYVDWRLNDIERVEVLIGPQGTLYGAGTLGGAVRYLPNKPQTDEYSAQIRSEAYDLNESDDLGYKVGSTVNIPIIEGSLAVRATVDYDDDPGFIDNNFLVREAGVSNPQPDFTDANAVAANLKSQDDVNTDETWSGRMALRYTGDKLDSTLSYYYQQSDIGGRQINHKDSFGTGDYESALRFEEPIDRENQLFALEIVADLGFAELTSATGYSEYDENGNRDQTDLLLSFDYYYDLFPSFSAFTRDRLSQDTFTQELRFVSTDDGPLNWIVGAFYSKQDVDQDDREYTPNYDVFAVNNPGLWPDDLQPTGLRPDSLEYIFQLDDENQETAFFGELGYQFTEKWQVTVGARWFKFENDTTVGAGLPLSETLYYGGDPDELFISESGNDGDEDDTTYKVNTSYYISDDIMTYATYSEGYRLGATNPAPPCQEDAEGNVQNVCALPGEEAYGVDTTTNYEIGLRSQWGDSVIVNAALYYVEWEDIQLSSTTEFGSAPITLNGNDAISQGVELSGQWQILDSLSLMGSYAYTDAELDGPSPGLIDGVDGEDGDRLPGTPEHQAYLSLNYVLNLSGGSDLDFDWNASYTSDVLTKAGERNFGEELDSFTVHNISATWLKDSWRVALYADNIFDEYAETGVRDDTSLIGDVNGVTLRRYYHNVIRPRQVGLRLVYNFEK
jgi:outer membrane receptor protein involved in Fe transport